MLGLSLVQVARVLKGDPRVRVPALAAHQEALEGRIRRLGDTVERVRGLRADLARGETPQMSELSRMVQPAPEISVAFNLPWPWGGERFDLHDIKSINYIIGPLFSGKTRLAQTIAQTLPNAIFLGLDRVPEDGAQARDQLDKDPALKARVDKTMGWLTEEGAIESPALIVLLIALEAENAVILVVDMVETGLDHASQEVLISHLRLRGPGARPLFLLTRSCAILDLAAVGPDEAIILCPANHSPPTQVAPLSRCARL